jgi:Fe-S-cluster containining protein
VSEETPLEEPTATATIALAIQGEQFEARVTVPSGPTSYSTLLPVFRALAEAIVKVGVEHSKGEGKTVSCAKGCGACCRQLVPISATEARGIRALLDGLPEPRQSEIRGRFLAARRRLEEAGLLDRLLSSRSFDPGASEPFGLEYFHLGVPCPFLEEEACSIYEERPIACREYLVTSDPLHCARPSAQTVACVGIASRVSTALCRLDRKEEPGRSWIPLIVAPEWAERNPSEKPPRPGPDLLRDLIGQLTAEG